MLMGLIFQPSHTGRSWVQVLQPGESKVVVMDDVDSSDSSAETASATPPFGSRLRRATLTLGVAIAVHVWVVPAFRPGPQIAPAAPQLVQAGVLAQPQTLAGQTRPARLAALPFTSGIRVTTDLIAAQALPVWVMVLG